MNGLGPDPGRRNDIELSTNRLVMDLAVEADAPTMFGLVCGPDRRTICQHLIRDGRRCPWEEWTVP